MYERDLRFTLFKVHVIKKKFYVVGNLFSEVFRRRFPSAVSLAFFLSE